MMIKLSEDCYVEADQIAEVTIPAYRNYVLVQTKNGNQHRYDPPYGKGVYRALDDLVAKINAATDRQSGEPA